MNIQQIRDRYDPENDAHPVTWLEMQLAEEIERLKNILMATIAQLDNLETKYGYLLNEASETADRLEDHLTL